MTVINKFLIIEMVEEDAFSYRVYFNVACGGKGFNTYNDANERLRALETLSKDETIYKKSYKIVQTPFYSLIKDAKKSA